MADFTRRRWTRPRLAIPRRPVDEEINPSSGWTNDFPGFHCLLVNLPGYEEDDIKLNVDEAGIIVVSGRRKVDDEKQEHFEKTFNVPEDGDVNNMKKIFDGATLRVRIPKVAKTETSKPSSADGYSINPSSRWTDEFPGFHCLLVNDLPGFNENDIKLNVDKPGIIVVSGRRKVNDGKQEHFEKTFNVPRDGDVKNIQKKFDGATLKIFIPKPVEEEIIPSSGWTNDIPGSHCLLVNLPVFKRDDMKMDVDESGVIVVSGRRQVGDRKQEHFTKAFYVPDDGDMKSISKTFEGDTLRVCIPKVATTEKGKPSSAVGASSTDVNNKDKKESNVSALIPDENPASSSGIMDKGKEASSSSNAMEKGKEASSSSNIMDKGKEVSSSSQTMEKGKEASSSSDIMDKGKEASYNGALDSVKEDEPRESKSPEAILGGY